MDEYSADNWMEGFYGPKCFSFIIDPEPSAIIMEQYREAITRQLQEGSGPDRFFFCQSLEPGKDGRFPIEVRTTFFTVPGRAHAVQCIIGSELYTHEQGPHTGSYMRDLQKRNEAAGYTLPCDFLPTLAYPDALKADRYPIRTSQEWIAVLHICSDSKDQRNFSEDEQAGKLSHRRPTAPFYGEVSLLDNEREAGYGVELLRAATRELDLDAGYILMYVSQVLAPPCAVQPQTAATAWIDLDDVARKTLGGYAANPETAARNRRKVYQAILFGARWFVAGERSIPYFDKQTGQQIDTRLYTSLWQIVSRQEPRQSAFFPGESVPVRLELVTAREWTALTTRKDTAQFVAFGEVLGSIPCGQPSGAWARALGMAYLIWARINMAKALAGGPAPTRRQLLDQFPPKVAAYEKLLGTTHAKRIYKYWRAAEDILQERGLIEMGSARNPEPTGSKAWNSWLDSSPIWKPGALLREALEAQSRHLYNPVPRPLNLATRRRRAYKAAKDRS